MSFCFVATFFIVVSPFHYSPNHKVMDIYTWLKDPKRSYKDGLEILEKAKHPHFAFYAKQTSTGPDSFAFRKLTSILQNEARKLSFRPEAKQDIPVIKVVDLKKRAAKTKDHTPHYTQPKDPFRIADINLVDIRELPENLRDDVKKIKAITADLSKLHAEMRAETSAQKRKKLLEDITAMESQRSSMWANIDAWREENKSADSSLSDEQKIRKEAAENAIKTAQRIDTLKININRAKKEIKEKTDLTPAKVKSREEKIKAWEVELGDLEKK